MKKRICFVLILCISLFVFSPVHAQQRKSVAVVLSGGGAKGVAHIGALKVIEEAGIPIDYIVGTSMGSIIGGLYSIGYTPHQLDSMVNHQNWPLLLSDRISWEDQTMTERQNSETYVLSVPLKKNLKANVFGGVIKGQNLANLFSEQTVGYHDSINFNKLPIPFACVSENIVNGDEVVFHNGVLATAMRASMAIPGVFTPVRLGDKILVDGGMKNNFPTNIARTMGADVIIGVDVQNDLRTADELNNLSEIFNQIINLTGQTRYEENIKLATVYIKVDVKGYSAASFNIPALTGAYGIIENSSSRDAYLSALKGRDGLSSPSVLALTAHIAAYQQGAPWLDALRVYLKDNLTYISDKMNAAFPELNWQIPQSTYLAWLDLRPLNIDDNALQKALIEQEKVAIMPGYTYGEEGRGFVRLNAGCPRSKLEKGVAGLINAIRAVR